MDNLVIIGTGLAGYTLAKEIRRLGSSMPLQLVSADDGRAYSKPMLSNALTRGKTADELATATATQMAAQLGASIAAHTRVLRIERAAKTIATEHGAFRYGRLILALGAEPIRLSLGGSGADAVMSINDLSDYGRFREQLKRSRRVLILGAGLIGCEFANDLANAGYKVDVVDPGERPLQQLLPQYCAQQLEDALRQAGVTWHFATTAQAIDRAAGELRVTLANGEQIAADLVLSAIGLRPRTRLARESGLICARGVQVDRYLTTSDENIFALGDCMEIDGLVLPYVMPIMHATRALAKTLVGTPTAVEYPAMPVTVKTPSMPVVAAPPPRGAAGKWLISKADGGAIAVFKDPQGTLLGFALTGGGVREKQAFTTQLPPVLA